MKFGILNIVFITNTGSEFKRAFFSIFVVLLSEVLVIIKFIGMMLTTLSPQLNDYLGITYM